MIELKIWSSGVKKLFCCFVAILLQIRCIIEMLQFLLSIHQKSIQPFIFYFGCANVQIDLNCFN